MNDIFSKSFKVTSFLEDGEERCCETGYDIESVGHGVVEMLDLVDVVHVVVEVE